MTRRAFPLLLLFTLSGVSGLVYEITWIRQLSHLLGGTTFAISTVLAAFMGGLALGSRYYGSRADRASDLLRLYARLEFGIAALGAASWLLIRLAPPVYASVAQTLPAGALAVLRVVVAMLVILPPTFLMGGTLPILSRFLVRESSRLGRGLGLLYAVNTFGAVLGCFLTGYVFVATLGVPGSVALAVGLNVLIGLGVLVLARSGDGSAQDMIPDATPDEPVPAPAAGASRLGFALLGVVFAASGFASLGYELYWSRALQPFLGNSTYAFSAMLTTFLLGLSVGGWVGGRLADRVARPDALLGWVQIGIGASCLATVPAIWGGLPELGATDLLNDRDLGWTAYLLRRFLTAFAVMVVPTLLIGMTFPIVNRIGIRRMDALGHGVGTLYFLNTLGSIAGSLAAGFLLLPLLAAKGALVATSLFSGVLGLLVLLGARRPGTRPPWAAAAAMLALAALAPAALDHGQAPPSDTQDPGDQVLFQREDHAAETRVYRKANGAMHMSVDGHFIGGTGPDIERKEKILAHLPLALRPQTRRVLAVGLGSGITLGTLALYDRIERMDCVEIVPGVVDGARLFGAASRGVMSDRRLHLHVGDGIQYLLTTPARFDVISSDSKLNPEYSGNAPLLARDYYELCRDRLTEGGVMVQWLACHQPQRELEIIGRSFADAFPHVAVFWYDPNNLIFAGSDRPLVLDLDHLRALADQPDLRADLDALALDLPYGPAGLFLADGPRLREILGEGPVSTWDRPRIEFSMLREYRRKNTDYHKKDNFRWMSRLRDADGLRVTGELDEEVLARRLASGGAVLAGYAAPGGLELRGEGLAIWQAALAEQPDDARLASLVATATAHDLALEALDDQEALDASQLVKLALKRRGEKRFAEALDLLDQALALEPDSPDIRYDRLLVLKDLRRTDDLPDEIADFRRRHPRDARGHALAGRLAGEAGRLEEAVALFREALELVPDSPVQLNNLAATLIRLERYGEAADTYLDLLELQPDFPRAAFSAAACLSMDGRLELSAEWMRRCIEMGQDGRERFETSRYFDNLRRSPHWPAD